MEFEYERDGFTVYGEGHAEFYGPYAECDGAELTYVEHTAGPVPLDLWAEVKEVVIGLAFAEYVDRGAHRGDADEGSEDSDYEDSDYWIDPESGEYRYG